MTVFCKLVGGSFWFDCALLERFKFPDARQLEDKNRNKWIIYNFGNG